MSAENILRLTEALADVRISFDIDGVVFNTPQRITDMFNQTFGTNYKFGETKEYYGIVEWFRKLGVVDPMREAMDFFNRAEVFESAEPNNGALLVLGHIYRLGVNPFYISSRPGYFYDSTLKSFNRWLPWVDPDQIIMSKGTSKKINERLKIDEIKRKGIVYHFEDSYEHATKIVAETKATVVLVRQPYNKEASVDGTRILRPEQEESMSNLLYSYRLLANKVKNS